MDSPEVFPDIIIKDAGRTFAPLSAEFISLGITTFREAARYVHALPYGYNTTRDDVMIIFSEGKGTCSTKHAAVATLAEELALPVHKMTAIYAMTEQVVTGAGAIAKKYSLPYIPMIHCFLAYMRWKVDLTEGNDNGKNVPLDDFLYEEQVVPTISEKDEYKIFRKALDTIIMRREEMRDVVLRNLLEARSEGIMLLRSKVEKK